MLSQMVAIEKVISVLGSPVPNRSIKATSAELETRLRALESAIESVNLAGELVAKSLVSQRVYVHPPVPVGSHEVTPFGRHMRDILASQLQTVELPNQAQSELKSEYEVGPSGMRMSFRQVDAMGTVQATRLIHLRPSAYQAWSVQPTTLDFDRLLHQGLALNTDFKVQWATSKGANSLLFQRGEEIDVMVKLNKPGYLYIVGHVLHGKSPYSYLLEIGHGQQGRRFIQFVNADDVNKWISLGTFEASAPFGVESLQLMASHDDPVSQLPAFKWDPSIGFYRLTGNAAQVVAQTRALKPKRTETNTQYHYEAVLMFTTMDR
jgi:hypothetical protein